MSAADPYLHDPDKPDDRPDLHLVDDVQPGAPPLPPGTASLPPDDLPDLIDDGDESADTTSELRSGVLVDAQVEADADRYTVDWDDPAARAELLPRWATDWATFVSTVQTKVDTALFRLKFHTVHLPLYLARLVGWTPRGVGRTIRATALWVADWNSHTTREALTEAVRADHRGTHDLRRLHEDHRNVVRIHLAVVAFALAVLAGIGAYLVFAAPRWQQTVATLGLVLVFGWIGHPPDRTISDRAVSPNRPLVLTSEVIVAALSSAGIQNMTRDKRDEAGRAMINFITPISRDGNGYRVDLDLPPGVTVEHVANKRAAVASGLRRPESCVFLEGDLTAHEGRLIMYVADKPLIEQKPRPWPLLKKGKVNAFGAFPIGVDARGRDVTISLMFIAGIVGAVPRMGKTALLRLFALALSLDPRCELHVWNFKGGLDWKPLALVAHAYGSSAHVPALAADLAKSLRRLVADIERRYDVIEGLGIDLAPDGKATDELASRPELGLHPVLLAIDECHLAFNDPDNGKEVYALIEDVVRRGPAVGIIVMLATQRPDSNSIPTGISSSLALRFCLRVTDHTTNDIVLGTGAYRSGYRANNFTRRDLGVAYMAGEEADAIVVRSAYVDTLAAQDIAQRARAAKVATGRLTGHAAGQATELDDDEDTTTILDDLLTVWPTGQARVTYADLIEALVDRYPARHGALADLTPTAASRTLGAAVRVHGLNSVQVAKGRKGLAHNDLVSAAADHHLTYTDDAATDPEASPGPGDGDTTSVGDEKDGDARSAPSPPGPNRDGP